MLKTYDAYGREKVMPSPIGAEVFVPVVLYDEQLTSDGTFDTVTIPDEIINVEMVLTGRTDRNDISDGIDIVLNGDATASNYRRAYHYAGDTHDDGAGSDNIIANLPAATASSGYWGHCQIWLPHVKYNEKHPITGISTSIRSVSNRATLNYSCLWASESAITSVKLDPYTGTNFVSGSRLQILGYKVMNLGASADPGVCNMRATLTNGTPVTTSDVTAATSVWINELGGNRVSLFNGANWDIHTFSPFALTVPSTTDTNYDIFAYLSNGAVTGESVAWTNDTTRATGITFQNGIYVKSGTIANRYIGSFRTTGVSGQTEDSITKRFLSNYYNKADRRMYLSDSNAHNYTTGTWRAWNNDATLKLEILIGVREDTHVWNILSLCGNSEVGITRDGTGAPTNNIGRIRLLNEATVQSGSANVPFTTSIGYHYFTPTEFGTTGGDQDEVYLVGIFKG